jgi:hypothetical protein
VAGWRKAGRVAAKLIAVWMGWWPAPTWAAEPSLSPAPSQPITVRPSWENAPWQDKVQTILNVTAQAALACCVLSLLVGGAALGIGRVTGSYQAGNRGVQLLVGGGAGALVVATAASVVRWLVS